MQSLSFKPNYLYVKLKIDFHYFSFEASKSYDLKLTELSFT